MLAELFHTNVLEVLDEQYDAENMNGKVTLRVLDDRAWISMMKMLIVAGAAEDGAFGLEVHKAFYKDPAAADVRFVWIIVYWGELDAVRPAVEKALTRKLATPPPFAVGRKTPSGGATAAVPTARAHATPPNPDEDDDPGPALAMREMRGDAKHNIKSVEHVNNGVINTKTVVRLAHAGSKRFATNSDPHEVITLESGRGRFKAVVQNRGETEFGYRREAPKAL